MIHDMIIIKTLASKFAFCVNTCNSATHNVAFSFFSAVLNCIWYTYFIPDITLAWYLVLVNNKPHTLPSMLVYVSKG